MIFRAGLADLPADQREAVEKAFADQANTANQAKKTGSSPRGLAEHDDAPPPSPRRFAECAC